MRPWKSGFLILLLVLGGASAAAARTWTDLAGRTVEGVFQDYDARSRRVSISLESGKTQQVRLDLLSRTDQEYVRDLLKQRGFADPGQAPPAPGSRLPGNPDQSAASNNGARVDSGSMSQDQGGTVGSVNAPPIPLAPFNGGAGRGPVSPFQGSAIGGRGGIRSGSTPPSGYTGPPRPGAGPTSNLLNAPQGGYDPERYMADDASGIANRENGPTSSRYHSPAGAPTAEMMGGGAAGSPGIAASGPVGPADSVMNGNARGFGSSGPGRGGPPSPFGPDGRLRGMGPPSPLDSNPSSPFGASGLESRGLPATPQPGTISDPSDPFGSGVGPAGSLTASRPPTAIPNRGPTNNPTDVGLSEGDFFSSARPDGSLGATQDPAREKLAGETEMILGGMALVGGLICGALGLLVLVGLVVLVIAMSRGRKTQTRVRYS